MKGTAARCGGRCASAGACVLALLLTACAQPVRPLYHWDTFPREQYEYLQRSGVSLTDQVRTLEAQAEKARGAGAALPPGFRAHLGMLKLGAGDADSARALWRAEIEAFPESAPYMQTLLKRLDGPAAPPPAGGRP